MSKQEERKIHLSKTSELIHQQKVANQDIVRDIQKATRETLLPTIKEKAEEVSKYIEETIKKDGTGYGLTSTQIFEVITKRSVSDIATVGSKSYTPQELAIALNIYIEMMAKINKEVKMPPSKSSFCLLLGIGTETYNNYMVDPERTNIMNIIDTYITGAQLTSAQTGELKEITTMFNLKAQHGFVEAQNPIVIQHESKVDVDDIRHQLNEMKRGRVTDAVIIEEDVEKV